MLTPIAHPSRRAFLQTAAAGALATWFPATGRAVDPALPQVALGSSLRVPLLGFGTGVKGWNRSNALARSGPENFRDTIRRAYDLGVRLFDCADLYGSLGDVARALKDKPRESYLLVSKVWCHPKTGIPADEPRDDSAAVVERFLREAGTDYLDLVQLHCQTHDDWTTRYRSHMDALARCKERGWIKAHGVSCHSLTALELSAKDPWVDVVHTRINPWGVKMDGPADQVVPVIRRIHAAGKGVIGMKLIGEGAFRDDSAKIDEALRFTLQLGCVDAIIVGFENPTEVADYTARLLRAVKR